MTARRIKFALLTLIPLVSLFALFSSFEIKENHSFWSRVLDAGHAPLFFLVTIWLYELLSLSPRSEKFKLNLACVMGIILAAAAEVIQPYFSRDAQLGDLINGALGSVLAAWLLHIVCLPRKFYSSISFLSVSLLVAGYALFPAFQGWQAVQLRDKSFPLIASFENVIELHLWSSKLEKGATASALFEQVPIYATADYYSLYVKTFADRYAGVSLDAGGLNFSKAKTFEFDIYNPGEAFELTIRIDDDGDVTEYGQRFNKAIPVRGGYTSVMIPVAEIIRGGSARKFNVSTIRRIMFFVGKDSQPHEFYLDNVRVEL